MVEGGSKWFVFVDNFNFVLLMFLFLQSATQAKKLTYMYLANDVIQNSRKKGPEYAKEFATVLKQAFENIAK